jgi:hypothetical protein
MEIKKTVENLKECQWTYQIRQNGEHKNEDIRNELKIHSVNGKIHDFRKIGRPSSPERITTDTKLAARYKLKGRASIRMLFKKQYSELLVILIIGFRLKRLLRFWNTVNINPND